MSLYIKNDGIVIEIETVTNEPSGSNELNRSNEQTLKENVVEKYLQSILKPLNMMQALFFCAKYKIRDNVIILNSNLYSFISVCFQFILLAIIFSLFFMTSNRGVEENFHYFLLNILDFALFFIGGFLNVFTNIRQRLNNIFFVLKIQNVHRILKLNGRSFKCFTMFNWICVIADNCFDFIWMGLFITAFNETSVANVLATYTFISFDINIVYATRSIKLVCESLKAWIENVKKSGFIDDGEDDQYWNIMFECYLNIIRAFQIIEETFHRMVLFYIVHTCCNTLLEIWMRVEMRSLAPDRSEIQYALLTFMSLTWVLKNLMLLTSLSVECERFYSAITEVQSTCIQIITSRKCSDTRRKICKNIQRVQNANFKKMDVCGLFAIDAEMPVNILGLITTYTIVLLQFEFL